MIESIFTLLGIDYRQFRILLKFHIKLDFRNQRQKNGAQTGWKKFSYLLTLVLYLVPSLLIAGLGVQRTNLFGFSLLTIALSMVFIILSIIIEFNEIIVNPDDSEILTFRPISSRTYFWVKMANLFFYVTTMGLALNLPPAIIGLLFPETQWTFTFLYLFVGWIAQITIASFVIILYSLLVRIFNYQRLKDVLAYTQVLFTFVIFVGYQFLIRLSSKIEYNFNLEASWNIITPPAWYGSIIVLFYNSADVRIFMLSIAAFLFTLFTFVFAFRNLSLDYAQTIYKLSESSRVREKVQSSSAHKSNFILKGWLIRDIYEKVGYNLVSRYMRRSRSLRTRIFPSFAMPLVIMGLMILDREFQDPFLPGVGFQTFMPMLFLVWVAVFFFQLIPTSDDWKASWIFHVIPIENFEKIYWGCLKAIIAKYITPYFLFVLCVLSTQMSLWHSFLVCFFNYIFFISYYIFMTFFLGNLPLSKKFERGQSNTRFMLTFVLLPLFVVGGILEYGVFQKPFLYPPGLLLLIVFGWISAKYSGRRFNKKIQNQECFF